MITVSIKTTESITIPIVSNGNGQRRRRFLPPHPHGFQFPLVQAGPALLWPSVVRIVVVAVRMIVVVAVVILLLLLLLPQRILVRGAPPLAPIFRGGWRQQVAVHVVVVAIAIVAIAIAIVVVVVASFGRRRRHVSSS